MEKNYICQECGRPEVCNCILDEEEEAPRASLLDIIMGLVGLFVVATFFVWLAGFVAGVTTLRFSEYFFLLLSRLWEAAKHIF